MQTPDEKKQMFLDMQEHPENYSEEQIEAMMDELDRVPDVETAWQKYRSEKGMAESEESVAHAHSSLFKVAASIISILMVSGITLAAIHIWSLTSNPSPKGEGRGHTQVADTAIRPSVPLVIERGNGDEAHVFDNVRLDTMLIEMADYYHVAIEFERDEARQLRLHFVWKRNENLNRVVERLNNFEAVNIICEPEKLIVR
jgi:hypothetical protein